MRRELQYSVIDLNPTAWRWNVNQKVLEIECDSYLGEEGWVEKPIMLRVLKWSKIFVFYNSYKSKVPIKTENLEGNAFRIQQVWDIYFGNNGNLIIIGNSEETVNLTYEFTDPHIEYIFL